MVSAAESRGVLPWRRPWRALAPANVISRRHYRGVNYLVLTFLGGLRYQSPWWGTFLQWKSLGGRIRRGEHGVIVVFSGHVEDEDEDEELPREVKNTRWIMRSYVVFNQDQVEGATLPAACRDKEAEWSRVEPADLIINNYLGRERIPVITGSRAAYYPLRDEIEMPPMGRFVSQEGYYSTLFHEMAHSTGHPSRLNRIDCGNSAAYSYEELVAEIAACILCDMSGIVPDIENSASYVRGWLDRIKADTKLLFAAASAAEKAVNFVKR